MKRHHPQATARPSTIEDRRDLTQRARAALESWEIRSGSIVELAAELHVSVRTLQRAFDACDTEYTRERAKARWAVAIKLLGSASGVELTSRLAGFQSTPHFVKAFDDHFGITPGKFARAAGIEHRLVQRRFIDRIKPVATGSSEYHRRRRRYNADVRALQKIVRQMGPIAQDALAKVRRPERVVFGVDKPWPRRVKAPGRSRTGFDEQFQQDLGAMFWEQEMEALVEQERESD